MAKTQPKIIRGLRECKDYLDSINFLISIPTLKKYIEKGLPCYFEFGKYHFHTDVIDDYFKARCRQQVTDAPDETED